MGLENWKTTPSLNSDTPPDGWPEGTMTVNQINDTGRQMMADVRAWYEDEGWNDMGDTHAYASATTTTIASDVTASYTAGRAVRADGSSTGTIYGSVVSSAYSAPNTTITYKWDGIAPAGLSNETLTISLGFLGPTNALPRDMKRAVNHAKAEAIASAATTDIWAATGNLVHVTGVGPITSFGTPPQAGAERFVIFDGACEITRDGSNIEVLGGASVTVVAGSAARIVADTTVLSMVYPYTAAQPTTGVAKAWGLITSAGVVTVGFNVASVTVVGTGVFTINFTTPFATGNYVVLAMPKNTNNEFAEQHESTAPTTSTFTLRITDRAGSAVSAPFHFVAYGTQ